MEFTIADKPLIGVMKQPSPGDRIVVRLSEPVPAGQIQVLYRELERLFPQNKILILPHIIDSIEIKAVDDAE